MDFHSEIEKVLNDTNTRIEIVTGQGNVSGFITGEFTMGGGNEFTNSFESSSQETANSAMRSVIDVVNRVTGSAIQQRKLQAINSTIHAWTGSRRPSVTIQMIFVAIKSTDDVRENVKTLYKTVYPTEDGLFQIAPLGYDGVGNGLISLSIGSWLAMHMLVATNVNAKFSQQVTRRGWPLFAEADITLEPYKQPTISDVEGYFI